MDNDYQIYERVAYIPPHANGDINHKDVKVGTISSINDSYVFVRFDKYVKNIGFNEVTAQGCDRGNICAMGSGVFTPEEVNEIVGYEDDK